LLKGQEHLFLQCCFRVPYVLEFVGILVGM
jgi:hypothetical protein